MLIKIEAWRSRSPLWSSLGVGALAAGAGALARWALLGGSTDKLAYLTFYPMVMIAALVGGLPGGICAVALCALVAHGVFIPLTDAADWLALAVFIASCAFIVGVTQLLLRTRASLLAAEASHAALSESEEKFRSTFANAAIGCATAIPDGAFIDANPAYCRLTGYGLDELRSMDFLQLFHPDDSAAHNVQIARCWQRNSRLRHRNPLPAQGRRNHMGPQECFSDP